MNFDEHNKKYRALNDWFYTPMGIRAAQAFADELENFLPQLRGDRLLQLGHCGNNPWLPELHYKRKMIISPCSNLNNTAITTVFNQLPIDRDSIDCIIAPLTFEAFSFEKNPMDELDRVLKSMGYIIYWGINPVSFWGAALRLGGLSIFGDTKTKLSSVFSIKRAALNRGYRQCVLSTFYYIPPTNSVKLIPKLEFLNEMGKMLWLFPAGFYCLIVQKHQIVSPALSVEAIEENFAGCVDHSLALLNRNKNVHPR